VSGVGPCQIKIQIQIKKSADSKLKDEKCWGWFYKGSNTWMGWNGRDERRRDERRREEKGREETNECMNAQCHRGFLIHRTYLSILFCSLLVLCAK